VPDLAPVDDLERIHLRAKVGTARHRKRASVRLNRRAVLGRIKLRDRRLEYPAAPLHLRFLRRRLDLPALLEVERVRVLPRRFADDGGNVAAADEALPVNRVHAAAFGTAAIFGFAFRGARLRRHRSSTPVSAEFGGTLISYRFGSTIM
jgi:hypothetical protein